MTFKEYVESRYLPGRVFKRSTRDNYNAKLRTQVYPDPRRRRLSAITPAG